MSFTCTRIFPVFQCALRQKYKCKFQAQSKVSFPPKYVLGANLINSFREQSSTSSTQSDEEDETEEEVNFTFITYEGEKIEVKGKCGYTIMQAGKEYDALPDATCNGVPHCNGCHVYVEEELADMFDKMSTQESTSLESTNYVKPTSRLSCQLFISKDIEGAQFQLPQPKKENYNDKIFKE